MDEQATIKNKPEEEKKREKPSEPHQVTSVQLIFFTILLSFVVSVAATILTVLFFSEALIGARDFNVFRQILPIKEFATKETNEKILRQDELIVTVVKKASPSVVSIVASKDVPVFEQYFISLFPDDPFFSDIQIPRGSQKETR
ncbi:MAG: hypothetical protein HYW88_02625, partial [Candidatus Sungbacteria bacterium]|nr:hypothetical protein [Candidatus Sungbacteria bacterium]